MKEGIKQFVVSDEGFPIAQHKITHEDVGIQNRLNDFYDKFPDNNTRIGYLVGLLEVGLDDKTLEKLGISVTCEEIKSGLNGCVEIKDREKFIEKIRTLIEPIYQAKQNNPVVFAEFQRKIFSERSNFTPVNEIISFGIYKGELHIHLAPASDFGVGKKIALAKDGLKKIAKIVSDNPEIKKIFATSWVVASNPGIFQKLGFEVLGNISDQLRKEHFQDENRPVSRAVISRGEFLRKYL